MSEVEPSAQATLFPKSVGERLREAREAQGLGLAEISARTRVPQRALEAVERGDFASLKAPTYAIGFARAYARAVGEDEVAVARSVRANLDDSFAGRPERVVYDAPDPARLPSRGVLLASAAAVLLLIAAVALWYGTAMFRGDEAAAPETASVAVPPAAPLAPATPASNVTLTALDEVWMRVYDADGNSLVQRTLAKGERFDLPATVNRPMINIGRPDKLEIRVNGSVVPPLGDGARALKDVPIDAAAILARPAPAPPSAAATPAASTDTARPASAPATRTTASEAPGEAAEAERRTPAATPPLPPAFAPSPAPSSRVAADTPTAGPSEGSTPAP